MPTVAREIDALGGTFDGYSDDRGSQFSPGYVSGYNAGHTAALDAANEYAENADALIEELMECVTDILDGRRLLEQWTSEARTLVRRAKTRRDA